MRYVKNPRRTKQTCNPWRNGFHSLSSQNGKIFFFRQRGTFSLDGVACCRAVVMLCTVHSLTAVMTAVTWHISVIRNMAYIYHQKHGLLKAVITCLSVSHMSIPPPRATALLQAREREFLPHGATYLLLGRAGRKLNFSSTACMHAGEYCIEVESSLVPGEVPRYLSTF